VGERQARGEPPPTRADLERLFNAEWPRGAFGDRTAEVTHERRVDSLFDTFWEGELATDDEAIADGVWFDLVFEPIDGGAPVVISGSIDRVDACRPAASRSSTTRPAT